MAPSGLRLPASPRKRGSILQRRWLWVPATGSPRRAPRGDDNHTNDSPRPGRRAARCDLLALGHGEQAFALRQLPGGFARAPDRFRLLAGLALRRFFIRLAALHLTKDALALQLLFEHLEGLIDVVVAYEYLQNVSDLLSSAARAVKLLMVARSARFEILRRLLAAVADHLVLDHLTLVERGQAGALDRGDMDEYVSAAVLGLNESIAFRRVEPFHGTGSHHGLL